MYRVTVIRTNKKSNRTIYISKIDFVVVQNDRYSLRAYTHITYIRRNPSL